MGYKSRNSSSWSDWEVRKPHFWKTEIIVLPCPLTFCTLLCFTLWPTCHRVRNTCFHSALQKSFTFGRTPTLTISTEDKYSRPRMSNAPYTTERQGRKGGKLHAMGVLAHSQSRPRPLAASPRRQKQEETYSTFEKVKLNPPGYQQTAWNSPVV